MTARRFLPAATGRQDARPLNAARRSLLSPCSTRPFRLSVSLALLLLVCVRVVPAQTTPDPLAPFLRGLADSTDVYFGRNAVVFDTTGIDSLIRAKGSAKPDSIVPHKLGTNFRLIDGFHRATGTVLGAGVPVSLPGRVSLDMEGSYGFANKEGRYSFDLSRTIARHGGKEGDSLRLDLAYARETVSFAAEHETPFASSVGAYFTGRDRQGVYERRGGSAALTWVGDDLFASAGWRASRDQSMPRASRFTIWGDDSDVPEVPEARVGSYQEGFARTASTRAGLPFAGAEGQYASRSRWRVRVALAQRLVLSRIEGHVQFEGGVSARKGPSQSRFELGGPLAIPSLGFGDGSDSRSGNRSSNRLLLAKIEFVHGMDLIRTLHVPYLSFMALHPAIFAHGGSVWAAEDGSRSIPPDASWRGAAGIAFVHIPGFPSPTTQVRLQMAWPVGRESGVARFSFAVGHWFDSIPRR